MAHTPWPGLAKICPRSRCRPGVHGDQRCDGGRDAAPGRQRERRAGASGAEAAVEEAKDRVGLKKHGASVSLLSTCEDNGGSEVQHCSELLNLMKTFSQKNV